MPGAVVLGASGCLHTEEAWKPDATCEVYACPAAACDVQVTLDMADIEACYGDEANLPDVLADCSDEWGTQSTCSLTFSNVGATKVGSPVEALSAQDAAAICAAMADLYSPDAEAMDPIDAQIDQDCEIARSDEPVALSCVESGTVIEVSECGEGARLAAPPDVQFELLIDPELSFAEVAIGAESAVSALRGNAFAGTSPAQFLVAFARGDDFELDDDMFTETHAALSAPIDVDPSSGTYSVPVDQAFSLVVQGLRDADEYAAGFAPSASSGGTFDPTGGVDVRLRGGRAGRLRHGPPRGRPARRRGPMIGRLVALSAAVGCAPCPALSEVPIAGGDASLAAIVRQELEAIEGELALGVCVDHVRLDAGLRTDRYGTYDPVTHGVRLAARDSAADVTRTLRHEVCHAVDLQNDVVLGSEALFPYPDPPPAADGHLVNEAFADVCELGAEALTAAWSDGCGGDPDLRALDRVRDEVFGGGDPGQGAMYQPVATYDAHGAMGGPVYVLQLREGSNPGRLLLDVLHGPAPSILRDEVDIWTGQPTDRTYRSLGNPDPVAGSAPPRWWAGKGGPLRADAPDGDVLSIAELSLPTGRVTRAVARVDGVWGPAAGPCANDTTTFFTFDGELWSGQYSDGALSWGRWVPGP